MIDITSDQFGYTEKKEPVMRYCMSNDSGMKVYVLDYGCTIQSVLVPDKNGHTTDVVLGYDRLEDYERGSCYHGALVGRYANRIKNAQVRIGGTVYQMERNNGTHHLHGCLSARIFHCEVSRDGLEFTYTSPEGEDGLPGNMKVTVRYQLSDDNMLSLEYEAETDAETVVNLTNHSYFNLNGTGDVLGHTIHLKSDRFTELDSELIPTGRILSVEGTPMDFRDGKRIGTDVYSDYDQIQKCGGYDHNFVLHSDETSGLFSEVTGDISGIRMLCYTTQPGVQFYTGNYLQDDTAQSGKHGTVYPPHAGFCLETQHYPSSPDFPDFPSTKLMPGERYLQKTGFRFPKL